jgi:hypothetical protein
MSNSFFDHYKKEAEIKRRSFIFPSIIRWRDPITIAIIYAVCHFPLLMLWEAKYWDDWLIFGVTDNDLIQIFLEAGFEWVGHLHLALRTWGPEGYKLVSFFALLIPSLAALHILKALGLSRREAFWTATLIAVLPFFFSRVAAINTSSAVLTALFFIAWVLLLADQKGLRGFVCAISAAAIFSTSLFYSSLASFYIVALITFAYKQRHESSWIIFPNAIALTPLIAFAIQRLTFIPSGNYVGYNSIDLSPIQLILTFINTAIELVNPSTTAGAFTLFFIAPIVVIGIFLAFVSRSAIFGRLRFHLLAFGAIGFAVAPYLVAGKYPSFLDWGSRLQILLPFGFALLIVESEQRIRAYLRLRYRLRLTFLLPVFVLYSCILWWASYIDYEVDWIKQLTIVEAIKQQSDLTTYNSFIVADEATYLNAHARSYRFYEVAGMLRDGGVDTSEIVATNFEVQSALGAGISWTEFRHKMNPFINGTYLLRRSKANEKIALLNFSSLPAAGVFKTQLAIKSWAQQVVKGENAFKPLHGVIVFSIHDVTNKYSVVKQEQ